MNRRYWKNLKPNSLRAAIEACVNFAREAHNLSVDRIADRMAMNSKFTLYKWMENGRMPAIEIPAFEHACGVNYVTRYLGHTAHLLVFDMPSGRGRSEDVNALQAACAEAVTSILRFQSGQVEASKALGQIELAMSHLAFHHADVEKSHQPEFEFKCIA